MGRAPRAILISVNPGIDDHERATRRASDAVWAHRLRTEPLAAVLDAWEAQPLFATQARADRDALARRRARRLALDPAQLARSLEVMGLAEMPDYRAEVDARCTLVVGADDAKYVALARALPARVEVIARSGHDPLLEQPEALAALLRIYLRAALRRRCAHRQSRRLRVR
jgi:2-succinyl-6-hydroxy-2,4-cyclohexadiene-1-carboxylate synthase